jgi:hypothetical protein
LDLGYFQYIRTWLNFQECSTLALMQKIIKLFNIVLPSRGPAISDCLVIVIYVFLLIGDIL